MPKGVISLNHSGFASRDSDPVVDEYQRDWHRPKEFFDDCKHPARKRLAISPKISDETL
jgi:hypothetical protein